MMQPAASAIPATPAIRAALVLGASGGIGAALCAALTARGAQVHGISRSTHPGFDITNEAALRAALAGLDTGLDTGQGTGQDAGIRAGGLDCVIIATGSLRPGGAGPEKRLRDLDPAAMAAGFAINTIGPALAIKHAAPLLARDRPVWLAALSARVGSIGDNALGGWYTYRASKAALNQMLRTAAIELARSLPQARIVALHPGTVRTRLSAGFTREDQGMTPAEAATRMIDSLQRLEPGFAYVDYDGRAIPF